MQIVRKRGIILYDKVDHKIVSKHKWYIGRKKTGYTWVYTFVSDPSVFNGVRQLKLGTLLLKPKEGFLVDHINGNPLDCRRKNIRIVTYLQNAQNKARGANAKSKYKGIGWDKANKKWRVEITCDKKRINIGRFESELFAAYMYNVSATKFFGEYARLNTFSKEELQQITVIKNTNKMNEVNCVSKRKSASGIKGVHYDSTSGKYRVRINGITQGKRVSLEEAVNMVREAKKV